jgi:predicted GTPase
MADVAVVNKVDAAAGADVQDAITRIRQINPRATIVRAASPVVLSNPGAVRGRRVLVVEDGPTITHGGMAYGAGYIAALAAGAAEIVDPRGAAVAVIKDVFRRYPHIGPVLPAVGYSSAQLQALEATINRAEADVVVAATPINLAHLIQVNKSVVHASYEFAEAGEPTLGSLVDDFLARV